MLYVLQQEACHLATIRGVVEPHTRRWCPTAFDFADLVVVFAKHNALLEFGMDAVDGSSAGK
jgi:hypothetical protein